MKSAVSASFERQRMRLASLADKVQLLSPQNILTRGYSLSTCNGHVVTAAASLKAGDNLVTSFKDGKVASTVTTIN
jgi:exodeoxyribonuclease VII large subunit